MGELWGAFRRRWWVALIGLLLTAGGLALVVRAVPPERTVDAGILLVPPVGSEQPQNPFLNLGGLQSPTEVLARNLSEPSMVSQLTAGYPKVTYTANRDVKTSAPVVLVSVDGADDASVKAVRDRVLKKAPEILRDMQVAVGVAPKNLITSTYLSAEATPTTANKATIRTAAIVGVLGLLLTFAGMVSLDRALLRRGARRTASDATEITGAEPPSEPFDGVGSAATGSAAAARATVPPSAGGDGPRS